MEYIAFFGALLHNQIDYVLEILKEYDIGSYLIGLEVTKEAHKETNGEHIHFLVQMSDKDYHKFSKRIFIDKYKLRGKALKDKPRQYGRVKKIEDFNKMGSYTLKDGNIRTNMTEEQLADWKSRAFKLKEKDDFRDKLMDHIKEQHLKENPVNKYGVVENWSSSQIGSCIIGYYRKLENKIPLSKSQVESHIRYYQMYHTDISDTQMYNIMFPFN